MNPEEFKKRLEEHLTENAGKIAPLPVEASEDTIGPHIERIRTYALEHPCIFDEDFVRVFGEGLNRAIFNYRSGSWLVSIIVSVAADEDFKTLFWQVSTAIISAFNGKARSIALLSKAERNQLQRSRDIVIADVSEAAKFGPVVQWAEKKSYQATCDLTAEETAIAIGSMTAEQKAKIGFAGKEQGEDLSEEVIVPCERSSDIVGN